MLVLPVLQPQLSCLPMQLGLAWMWKTWSAARLGCVMVVAGALSSNKEIRCSKNELTCDEQNYSAAFSTALYVHGSG